MRRRTYRQRNIQVPRCPFCEEKIRRPVPPTELGLEFDSGSCGCGALFVCDPTGKKQGAALMEGLTRLAGGGVADALKLELEKDYRKKTLVDYNTRIHRLNVSAMERRRRKIFSDAGLGVLLFLKRVG